MAGLTTLAAVLLLPLYCHAAPCNWSTQPVNMENTAETTQLKMGEAHNSSEQITYQRLSWHAESEHMAAQRYGARTQSDVLTMLCYTCSTTVCRQTICCSSCIKCIALRMCMCADLPHTMSTFPLQAVVHIRHLSFQGAVGNKSSGLTCVYTYLD